MSSWQEQISDPAGLGVDHGEGEGGADGAHYEPLHTQVRSQNGGVPPAPAGPGRRYVLNVWTADSGWVRHQFATEDERRRWAREDAPLGADVRWSDR